MAEEQKILLGKIIKLHGYRGAVTIKVNRVIPDSQPLPDPLFLEVEGKAVPFFISDYHPGDPGFIHVTFSGYSSPGRIKEFIGCNVLVIKKNHDSLPSEEEELEGFTLFNQRGEKIGVVNELIKNPAQWIVSVRVKKQQDVLIPFHEDLIISLNIENNSLVMRIPEGIPGLDEY